MEYRRLGRTELRASVLGVGGGYLSLVEREEGTRLYERAAALGVNYFDGRYGDSSAKLAPLLRRNRERYIVATKTAELTAAGARARIVEDLRELDTTYIDVFLLRTYTHAMLDQHLAPGGTLEGVLRARDAGQVRFTGLAAHGDLSLLARGIATGLVDVVLLPLNIVRREALESVVPLARAHDVGLVAMKPLSAGTIPAAVALPWLAAQPIHTIVPGMRTIAHLEESVAALTRASPLLSVEEQANVERWRQDLDRRTCRICDRVCQPVCERGLAIDHLLHHDVYYNECRNAGLRVFLEAPLAPWVMARLETHFARLLEAIGSCSRCGRCEAACPHGLSIVEMLQAMVPLCREALEAVRERGWSARFAGATSPYDSQTARS